MFAVVETVFILIEKDFPSRNKSRVLLCINLSLNISCGVLMSISTISCGVFCIVNQGPVVSIYFKKSENDTPIDPDKTFEEIFSSV